MTIDNIIKGLNNIPREMNRVEVYLDFYQKMYGRGLDSQKDEPILAILNYQHKIDRMFRLYTHLNYSQTRR